MKVLSIGSDRKLFEEGSAVRARQVSFASLVDELHIVVFTRRLAHRGLKKIQIAENAWVYPTRSWSRFFYMKNAAAIGKKIIRERGFEKGNSVITCQDPFESGTVGVSLKRVSGLPLHLQIHTDFMSPYFGRSFLNKVRVSMAKRNLPLADGVRAVSQRIADSLSGLGVIAPIIVLPIYVDVKSIADQKPERDLHALYPQFNFIILMASRLTHEKNISFALEVFRKVLSAHPKAGLIIVGEGPHRHKLMLKVKSLQLGAHVVFEPWQSDLVSLYKTANVFLSTSLYEGYGMTLVEAAAAGCPIITSDVGIAGDLLKDGEHALICPVGDKHCFVKNLYELIGNNQKRELMRHGAEHHILKEIGWSNEEYMNLYKDAILQAVKRS